MSGEAEAETPVAVPPTCSRCGTLLQADGRFCPRCGQAPTEEAAARRLAHPLAEDAGMTRDDPQMQAAFARAREEMPEGWHALVQMLTVPAKA